MAKEKKNKVTYQKTTIKQLVKIVEPIPVREITYNFSGRTFFKKRGSYS